MFFRALRRALSLMRKRKKHNPTAEKCQETTPREKEVDPSWQRTNNNDTTRSSLLFTEVPSTIVMEILSRLPVRDVIRARCVSKTWSALIVDPYFAQLHLSRAPPSYTRVAFCPEIPRITRFVLADVERNESRDYFVHVKQLNPRFALPGDNLKLKTSCNGLLCLVGPKANDRDVVYVCNPLLGEYTTLPEIEYKRYKRFILGFGLTRTRSGDYKVLQGVRDLDSRNSALQVHKLGTRTWKRLQDIQTPYSRFEGLSPGTFLHGSLHWVSGMYADGQFWQKFLSFDLQSEQLKPFPGPDLHWRGLACLVVSGGLLCLLLQSPISWYMELWIMKKYGVKESWTKINTISLWDPLGEADVRMHYFYHLLDYGSRGGDELGKDGIVVIASRLDGIWIVRGNKRESGRVSMPGKKNLVVHHFEGDIVQETYSYFIFKEWSKCPGNMATSLVSLRNIVGEDDLITI